jgi:hypothetical protein
MFRRHRLHDRRPHGGGGQRRGWPDDPAPRRRPRLSSPSPVRDRLRCADAR